MLSSSSELNLYLLSLQGFIILLAVIGTASLFYALFVIQATFSFWTTETLALMNITTYGGLESAQYPMSIYTRSLRRFFTFIIPLACVAYHPMAIILQHKSQPLWLGLLFPLAGLIFLFLPALEIGSASLSLRGARKIRSHGKNFTFLIRLSILSNNFELDY